MIKIMHYEVYSDKGNGWRLEERFDETERQRAFELAKVIESENYKVKIIREIFDIQDNSYSESIEYIRNNKSNKNTAEKNMDLRNLAAPKKDASLDFTQKLDIGNDRKFMIKATVKLLSIIFLCLIFSNITITLIHPIIEEFTTDNNSQTITFIMFFIIFIGITVPLVLNKVPWQAFVIKKRTYSVALKENDFLRKSNELLRLYNINDDVDQIVTPVYPEAPLEYKQYIVSFLGNVISSIDSENSLKSAFSRLGIKLIVYGGCLELSKYSGLSISQANSLLHEAFIVLDGDNADIEDFYESKRSYKNSQEAVFLTGVGGYLMASIIRGNNTSKDLVKIFFDKWEALIDIDDTIITPPQTQEAGEDVEPEEYNIVNIQNDLKFIDDNAFVKEGVAEQLSSDINNIINNLIAKFDGTPIKEDNGITSIKFKDAEIGMKFAKSYLNDISLFQDKLNNENLVLRNRCIILDGAQIQDSNFYEYLDDIFEHVYNNEIILTEAIMNRLSDAKYKFDFLGEKNISHSAEAISLYKLLD